MDEDLLQLHGKLTAQGYVLELVLGTLIKGKADPLEILRGVRNALELQMRDDATLPPTDTPHAEFPRIQAAALAHMHELIDRVRTQLDERPGPEGLKH